MPQREPVCVKIDAQLKYSRLNMVIVNDQDQMSSIVKIVTSTKCLAAIGNQMTKDGTYQACQLDIKL